MAKGAWWHRCRLPRPTTVGTGRGRGEVSPPPAPRAWPEGRGHCHPPHPKATEVTLRRDTERCLEPPSRSGTPCSRAGGFGLLGGQNGPARTDLPRTGPPVSPQLLPTPRARRPPPSQCHRSGMEPDPPLPRPQPQIPPGHEGGVPACFWDRDKVNFWGVFPTPRVRAVGMPQIAETL